MNEGVSILFYSILWVSELIGILIEREKGIELNIDEFLAIQ